MRSFADSKVFYLLSKAFPKPVQTTYILNIRPIFPDAFPKPPTYIRWGLESVLEGFFCDQMNERLSKACPNDV